MKNRSYFISMNDLRLTRELGMHTFSLLYYLKNGEDMTNELKVYCVSK